MRSPFLAFALQNRAYRARSLPRNSMFMRALAACICAFRLTARSRRSSAFLRWPQFHSRAARLGQPDSNSLFRRPGAVLPFPDMTHLFANEFARLRAGRFSLSPILSSSFQSLFFRHSDSFAWEDCSSPELCQSRMRGDDSDDCKSLSEMQKLAPLGKIATSIPSRLPVCWPAGGPGRRICCPFSSGTGPRRVKKAARR